MSVEGMARGDAQLAAGAEFGGFRIERALGHGGMGIVYLARELRLDRLVALKVIRPELAGEESFRARFRSESLTAASVEHPRVVTIFGAGEREGLLYVSMRYVDGRDLGRLISADGPLAPDQATALITQLADGLDAVHAGGLVHRDVKPANVIVERNRADAERAAFLTDFGLAKAMASTAGLTATGEVIGSVDYMAPEQIEGRRVDARTDVYALGCVLFHAVTGKVPFPERESSAKMWAHLNEPPPAAAATRGEAVTEPEHVVASGDAAPLPETVRLSRDPTLPPTDPLPRRRKRRRWVWALAVLVVIAALGVGAVIAVPKLSDSGKTPVPTGIAVPSLAGQPLDVAEQRLDALGLRSTEEGGGIFGILVPSDWNVCQTSPGPGTRVRRGATVSLLIDRPGVC